MAKKANSGNLNSPDWYWWLGVVEDRIDGYELGRYKVRIMGYHTANKEVLPPEDLPWATPLNPVTSAGISGVMETPSIVPGSTVIGFFADGENGQVPIILGTIAGHPIEKILDENGKPLNGFSDPSGVYPKSGIEGENDINESDLPRLARGKKAEEHASLANKREQRVTEIKTARAPSFQEEKIADDKSKADYETKTWDEPHPRGAETLKYFDPQTDEEAQKGPDFDETTSVYPYNKVRETESGHVFEIDDTPNNGRISEYHNQGTFREIQKDGTRVQKIVGSDYEIVAKDKNVLIKGAVNVTIGGDCKLLVEGNKYEEIEGDHFVTILGDRITKINGNDIKGVGTDENTLVNANRFMTIGKGDEGGFEHKEIEGTDANPMSQEIVVQGNRTLTVTKNSVEQITESKIVQAKNIMNNIGKVYYTQAGTNVQIGSGGLMTIGSNGNMTVRTESNQNVVVKAALTETVDGAVNETYKANQTTNITGTLDLDASVDVDIDTGGNINLN